MLLQFSSAKGPIECAYALTHIVDLFQKEASSQDLKVDVLEIKYFSNSEYFSAILFELDGEPLRLKQLLASWCGSILWIGNSPFRPKHQRKNWFIGCDVINELPHLDDTQIRYETMRASGAGGQHVNKTESAIRAVHIPTKNSVKVQSERSQHANKKLALRLLQLKLRARQASFKSQQNQQRHQHHQQISRGNPVKIFKGIKFVSVNK